MGKFVFGLGALVVLAVLVFQLVDPVSIERRQTAADYERQSLALRMEREQSLQPVSTGVVAFLQLAACIALVAVGMWAYDVYVQRRIPLVRPDVRGVLPVSRSALTSADIPDIVAASLAAFHQTQYVSASRPAAPHTLNYAPKYAAPPVASASAVDVTNSSVIPSFASLMGSGEVINGELVLGVDAASGDLVRGSWLDLYSTAVAGLPGSGKTTTQRFLASQTALRGARFVVVDPHAGASDQSLATTLEPLSSSFLAAPASSDKDILSAVSLVASIGRDRLAGRGSSEPVILWLDELTALLNRSSVASELGSLLEAIAQEYRKVNVFACASGQIWSASRTGGNSALRDSFASAIVHRMKRAQARMLIPGSEAVQAESLTAGEVIYWRASGDISRLIIPNTTAADVVAVGSRLVKPNRSQTVAETIPATMASGSRKPASADASRVTALFLGGSSPADIVLELRGVKSSEGSRYQSALSEVLQLLRDGISS